MIAVAVLVGLPCFGLLVAHFGGRYLPAHHVVTVSAVVPAELELVWTRIRAVADYPSWRRGVKRVELVAAVAGAEQFREVSKHNDVLYQVEECEPPTGVTPRRARVVHRIADDTLPFAGRWIIEATETEAGTQVHLREEGLVKSPIFRSLGKLFFEPTESLQRYVDDLRAALARAR